MEGLALAGLIVAAVKGTIDLVDFIVGNNEAIDQLGTQKENLETTKKDQEAIRAEQLKQAQENADLSYQQDVEKRKTSDSLAKTELETQFMQNWKDRSLEFETKKKDVFHNADESDKAETFKEWNYSQTLNQQLGLLSLSENSAGLSYNDALMNAGRSKGQALASMASSGTRNSSINAALDLEEANNAMQLQLAQDQQRGQIAAQRNSLLLQNAANNFAIQQTRNTNNYNRAQYMEGGGQYNLYQNELSKLYSNRLMKLNEIDTLSNQYYNQRYASWQQDKTHLQNMYDADMKAFRDLYEQNKAAIQYQIDDRQDVWKNIMRGSTALLGGSVEGWNAGTQIGESIDKYFVKS